jgi:hypothetical protein
MLAYGGKLKPFSCQAAEQKLPYCRSSAWHAPGKAPILNSLEFLGLKHDLQANLAISCWHR